MNLSLLNKLRQQFTKENDIYKFACTQQKGLIDISFCQTKCRSRQFCSGFMDLECDNEKILLLDEFELYIKLRMNTIHEAYKRLQEYRSIGDKVKEQSELANITGMISRHATEIAQKEKELDEQWDNIESRLLPF